ncbi:hypothetical protein MKW98_009933 [Papaver atlanticum]|uniref:BHLH domain-containing protein n=1 Tax=Papaver atlanticum TaxID=357466 RepID=A0AAD4T3B4_9MAGN|nr:hypothetical protein MKW98_009933 [Papaver atlanticum]
MSSASCNDNCSSNSCTDDHEELNEQLQSLLSLLPTNVTQTDPISILEQTRDYLRRIHEETETLEKEMLSRPQHLENLNQRSIANSPSQRRRLQILRVETDNIRGKREFVVKILWKRLGPGAAAEVQRAIEFCSDLNVKMNSVLVPSSLNPDEMQTTAFVKVKKDRNITEKKLCDLLLSRFPS